MNRILLLVLVFVCSGCFKENPQLPQYIAKQNLDVAVDSVLCYSGYEDFTAYQLTCSLPNDSVHWYDNYQSATPDFLGNENPLSLPTNTVGYNESIQCLRFVNGDTLYSWLEFMYCGRNIYIPRAFSARWNDGLNDTWRPIVYNGSYSGLINYTIEWEIRTMDGIQMFATSDPEHYWDGTYNGYDVPLGTYFFYILLEYDGEEPVEYTGIVEVLE